MIGPVHLFDREIPWSHRGFTLIELLVAVAVLSLLLAALAQVLVLTEKVISLDANALDTSGQARLVFDRIGADLAARPQRPDLGMTFTKAKGNDRFQFYSEVKGYTGARQVTGIGYRIQETTIGRIYQLERGAVGTDWGPAPGSNPFVQFLPNGLAVSSNSDPNYEVLGNEVFRLEICYLLNTGLVSNSAAADYGNVSAVLIAVGLLDNNSRKILSDQQLQQLSIALPDNSEGQDPLSAWNTALIQSGFAPGIPPKAIQNIRLYERSFCVP